MSLAQGNNTPTWPRIEPGSPDPESDALTTRPVRSPRQKVKQTKGQRVFKFGGGTCLQSKGEYSLPVVIAGKEATINTDVVESDIPLLLSRTAMKKAAVKMDLENDTATIMGKEVALNLTTSGHYCIPIDTSEEVPVENVCAVHLASEQVFENGDRVFYKREGKERWLGPGKVVFQDGKVVFVRHGGVFVRVSPNRLQKVNSYLTDEDERKTQHSIEEKHDNTNDENQEMESHTITEEVPATSQDREVSSQNVQQIRKNS